MFDIKAKKKKEKPKKKAEEEEEVEPEPEEEDEYLNATNARDAMSLSIFDDTNKAKKLFLNKYYSTRSRDQFPA